MNRRTFLEAGAAVTLYPAFAEDNKALAHRLSADPHRPQFHFLPPANWMNDPDAPLYWNGKYHMFYQHNPNGAYWANMHWGHAVSDDMIHWKHLPIALAPTPGGPDKDGVFTGSAVIDNGVPTVVYTGVRPEVVMIATSDNEMIHWTKFSGNPVISRPPGGAKVVGFRDPCVWKENDGWYMIVGTGIKGESGGALLFQSSDLRKWHYLDPLCTGKVKEKDEPGLVAQSDMWECPDFFPLFGKHALIVSTKGKSPYFIGKYTGRKFYPETEGHTDFGAGYAAKTMTDATGRRIYWSWIRERRGKDAFSAAGWSGVMSLPHLLTLRSDSTLGIEPLPQLKTLRGAKIQIRNIDLRPGKDEPIKGAPGDTIEILAEFELGNAQEIGLKVRASPDGGEYTVAGYDRVEEQLFTDTAQASLNPDTARAVQKGHFALGPTETLRLHIFLDGSVMEVFANGRACLTERMYPTQPDSLGLSVYARGGTARAKSIEIWPVRPISTNRLTSTPI
jgi:beta-fructofuranosidase